jgi:hypothetical protein
MEVVLNLLFLSFEFVSNFVYPTKVLRISDLLQTLQNKTKVVIYTKQPRTNNMKIRYQKWTCAGCKKIERIPEKAEPMFTPYWFSIKTTSCSSSSGQPSFDTFACSTECLKKAGESIQMHIKDHKHFVPSRQDNQVTICDQCGKIVTRDLLNPVCGGGNPLRGWILRETYGEKLDFCSTECEKNNILKPEDAVFFEAKLDNIFKIQHMLEALEAPDFREAFKALKESMGNLFKLNWLSNLKDEG